MSEEIILQEPVLPPAVMYGIFVDCGMDLIAGAVSGQSGADDDTILDAVGVALWWKRYRETFNTHQMVAKEQNDTAVNMALRGFKALQALGLK